MASAPVKDSEPTIGRLVSDATKDISTIIHKEIELAKSELKVSVKAGGMGIGLFAAAGFLLLMFLVLLSFTVAFLIHWGGDGLALHWSFGIVTLFYLLLALLLALVGYRKVRKVRAPEATIRQAKETANAFKR